MSDYAIGDIQGCYEPLQRLLVHIKFDDKIDKLWLVGDLVNRGPESLAVLRFLKSLIIKPNISLGNHDLHLLYRIFVKNNHRFQNDTLDEILNAADNLELGHWLRNQQILCYSKELNVVMCHAGIAPFWDLPAALIHAKELETVLAGDNYYEFLSHMYGNKPNSWSEGLGGIDRLRIITNYFTRMRVCDAEGQLDFQYDGALAGIPENFTAWFAWPRRKKLDADLIFGHWAALHGNCPYPKLHAIDTGCIWGGELTAIRLQDKQRFSVQGMRS